MPARTGHSSQRTDAKLCPAGNARRAAGGPRRLERCAVVTAEQACIGYAAAQQRAEQGHIRHGGIGRVDVFARRALTADRAGGCQQRARLQLRLDGGAGRDLDEGLRAEMVQLLHGDGHRHTAEAAAHHRERFAAPYASPGRIFAIAALLHGALQQRGIERDLLRIRHKNDARRHGIDAEVVHRTVGMDKFLTSKAHFDPSSSSAARMAMRVAVSIRRARCSGSA